MPETYLWILFLVVFVVALTLDLFVFQRKAHVIPVREALKLTGFWIALALAFNAFIYFTLGAEKALLFSTAYLTEYSLSVDNLFVFLAVFTYFAVPREAQRKVLLWGILGAIFFRAVFIFAGIALIERFHFLLYVLGLVLLYTAFKLISQKEKEVDPEKNPVVRLGRKIIPIKAGYEGSRFMVKEHGHMHLTPLLLVLLTIETMDVMFAIDSVPAVLGITLDPFIVYTSNVFAILGLRALFFALAGLFYLFRYLVYGLSMVLAFVGFKMLLVDFVHVSTVVSVVVVFGLILGSILASLLSAKKNPKTETAAEAECAVPEGKQGK